MFPKVISLDRNSLPVPASFCPQHLFADLLCPVDWTDHQEISPPASAGKSQASATGWVTPWLMGPACKRAHGAPGPCCCLTFQAPELQVGDLQTKHVPNQTPLRLSSSPHMHRAAAVSHLATDWLPEPEVHVSPQVSKNAPRCRWNPASLVSPGHTTHSKCARLVASWAAGAARPCPCCT